MSNQSKYDLTTRTDCRICGSKNLFPYLDLGNHPPSNAFISEKEIPQEQLFPLKVYLCRDCGLSQLLHIVSANTIFDDYAYLSSTSKALCEHYSELVNSALSEFCINKGSLVVDIGCNDGIMLKQYPKDQFQLVGVEPSSAGEYAKKAGFTIIDEFFDGNTATQIKSEFSEAQVITATNVFAHVDDIHSFTSGIEALLARDGVFIIEFPYLGDMLDRLYFDTVYHEHLCYFALTPLIQLFTANNLRAFNVKQFKMGASGPALRLFVCKKEASFQTDPSILNLLDIEEAWGIKETERYEEFSKNVASIKEQILAFIGELLDKKNAVGGFCAPAKGNTLLNYLGLTKESLTLVAENNALKIGKVTPGSHLPIVDDQEFLESKISHALLLAWNYTDYFLENSDFVRQGGKFIIPFPFPYIAP